MATTLTAPCDRASASAVRGVTTRHPLWTLIATILASSLAFIDGSVVTVALPAIGHSYAANASDLQWTVNAYLLPLSALLLLGGAAGDHYGRRRLLIAGTVIFTLASIGCAIAPNLSFLLAARAIQGIGAALLMPNSLAILGGAFIGEEKGRAIGTWAAAGAIASAVGPPAGGWLVGTVGWQAIFLLNVPVAIAVVAIVRPFVDEAMQRQVPLDIPGAILATTALGVLTWALTLSSGNFTASGSVWGGLILGLLVLGLFLFVEYRLASGAMMPLGLFASRAFIGLTALTFLLYGALGGLLVLLPYVLIEAGGQSPLAAGLALLPFPLVIGSTSRFLGQVAETTGPRWPLALGPLVTGVGFLLLVRVTPEGNYWATLLPAILVIACGMAGAVAPLTTAVLSSVDDRHTATASGFNSAIARTGGLIATALAGGVIAQRGATLVESFHVAAVVGAVLAFTAGLVALTALKGTNVHTPDKS
jgi:EmrB/QacA subfamily drug resistance transporter